VREGCTTAGIGCIECKKAVIPKVLKRLRPIQERRDQILEDPEMIWSVLKQGGKKARSVARKTMLGVRRAMALE
jgi:tryptophanyl-tRNA synthetase